MHGFDSNLAVNLVAKDQSGRSQRRYNAVVDSINVERQGCVLKRFEQSAAIERLERLELAAE